VPGRRVTRVCYSLAAPNPLRAKAIASGAEAERVLQKLGAQSTQHWPQPKTARLADRCDPAEITHLQRLIRRCARRAWRVTN
jgi:hypothetical protein